MARTIIVIGNCTVDIALRLERFPLPGETLLTDSHSRDVGGKGANQAVAAARMGVDVAFLAAVGNDDDGRFIRDHLEQEGINVEHVRQADGPTDISIIYVTDGGENSIVSTHAAAGSVSEADVDAALERSAAGDVVLMQGNLDLAITEYALRRSRQEQLTTILDPAPIQYPYDTLWPYVDYAVPNEVEVRSLTSLQDTLAAAEDLLGRGARHVIVTLGEGGAVRVDGDGQKTFAAEAVDAIDATGAGDVFCGVLAASIALAMPVDDAIATGVRAATMSVTRMGTQSSFPSRVELAGLTQAAT